MRLEIAAESIGAVPSFIAGGPDAGSPGGSEPDSGLILTFLPEGVLFVRILNVKDTAA